MLVAAFCFVYNHRGRQHRLRWFDYIVFEHRLIFVANILLTENRYVSGWHVNWIHIFGVLCHLTSHALNSSSLSSGTGSANLIGMPRSVFSPWQRPLSIAAYREMNPTGRGNQSRACSRKLRSGSGHR